MLFLLLLALLPLRLLVLVSCFYFASIATNYCLSLIFIYYLFLSVMYVMYVILDNKKYCYRTMQGGWRNWETTTTGSSSWLHVWQRRSRKWRRRRKKWRGRRLCSRPTIRKQHSKKFQVQLRNEKYLEILYNYGKTKNIKKK